MVAMDAVPVVLCGPHGVGGEGGLSSLLWEEEEDSFLDRLERNNFFILIYYKYK